MNSPVSVPSAYIVETNDALHTTNAINELVAYSEANLPD